MGGGVAVIGVAGGAAREVMSKAYANLSRRVARGPYTKIDPYAAERPGEFFVVLSGVFFAEPKLLRRQYPDVYRAFAGFYRQDPLTAS